MSTHGVKSVNNAGLVEGDSRLAAYISKSVCRLQWFLRGRFASLQPQKAYKVQARSGWSIFAVLAHVLAKTLL